MPSSWKPFLLPPKSNGIPPLLIKYHFGTSDYKVWLTDLTYIWTESLDRRQIVLRAFSIDTCIDPSEDSAQLRLFFGSIADALRQCPGTDVTLDQSSDIKQLTLNTSTPLPHPLRPLKWSIALMLAPQYEYSSEFVSPILSQQLTARVEKTSLLQQLREKDNVIAKLIEKVQGDGLDLVKLFPGALLSKSAAGHTTPGTVSKSIKGLREFDQSQWEAQLAKEKGISGDIFTLLPRIFDHDEKAAGEGLRIADFGEWWKTVGSRDLQRKEATSAPVEADGRKDVLEDDFQRQLTPTRPSVQTSRRKGPTKDTKLKISVSPGKRGTDENDSTTGDSDDDLQLSHSHTPPSGRDDVLASSPTKGTECRQSDLMDMDDDDFTAPVSDIDKTTAKSHPVPNSKQKLGKIGGKGKGSSPEAPGMPTSKPKLGKIGGKGKLGGIGPVSSQRENTASDKPKHAVNLKQEATDPIAAPKSMEPERSSRTAEQPPELSPPRETSQERADRKRAQLKRELENKSHAAVKKKRRF